MGMEPIRGPFMNSSLSQADVARLVAEPSPLVRAELAGKVGSEIDSPALTEAELAMVQDIVRIMANDAAESVRAALSQNIRESAHLPHDVALKMANDIESVALPILHHSQVLTDADLIAIVKGGGAAKHEAIAARPAVSETVSEALVAQADETAVATLMGNPGARIGENALNTAVDRFAGSDLIKEKMVRRAALPLTVTERLVTLVSESLKDHLVSHHELPPAMAADVVMQSRERSLLSIVGATESPEHELAELVSQMYRSKRLTPSLVLRSLCMGDIDFFEAAMAISANVPLANAHALIHDGGPLGLKAIFEKSGLPERYLPAMRVAVDVVHETGYDGGEHDLERYRARVIERILTQHEDFGGEDLDYLLRKVGEAHSTMAKPAAA